MNRTDRGILFSGALLSVAILTMPAAKAYIDPSVTTYAIQAVVGIAVAVGAVVAIWWRRARKKVAKTLHIDENQNKVMEDELMETAPENQADNGSAEKKEQK